MLDPVQPSEAQGAHSEKGVFDSFKVLSDENV